MSYFARVKNGIVDKVIVAEIEFFDTFVDDSPGEWIQTFTNGVRKNCAVIGFTYDKTRDAFYAPQPYPSWTLDEDTCQWESPVAYPEDDKMYAWDEEVQNWAILEEQPMENNL